MIFAVRQLQEKCQEMRTHLYSTIVDLTKAFDTDAYRDEHRGISIANRTDDHLLNQRRMHFHSRISTNTSRTSLRRRVCPEHHLGRGDAMEHGHFLYHLREIRSDHQLAEDGDDTSTATQLSHTPESAANQGEWNPTASGGELPVPGQCPLPQHQDR
nr:unnamed protein product [Spirometra erinaceieuropaei]